MNYYIFEVRAAEGWRYLMYTATFKYGIAIATLKYNATRIPENILDIVIDKVNKFEFIYDFRIRQCVML